MSTATEEEEDVGPVTSRLAKEIVAGPPVHETLPLFTEDTITTMDEIRRANSNRNWSDVFTATTLCNYVLPCPVAGVFVDSKSVIVELDTMQLFAPTLVVPGVTLNKKRSVTMEVKLGSELTRQQQRALAGEAKAEEEEETMAMLASLEVVRYCTLGSYLPMRLDFRNADRSLRQPVYTPILRRPGLEGDDPELFPLDPGQSNWTAPADCCPYLTCLDACKDVCRVNRFLNFPFAEVMQAVDRLRKWSQDDLGDQIVAVPIDPSAFLVKPGEQATVQQCLQWTVLSHYPFLAELIAKEAKDNIKKFLPRADQIAVRKARLVSLLNWMWRYSGQNTLFNLSKPLQAVISLPTTSGTMIDTIEKLSLGQLFAPSLTLQIALMPLKNTKRLRQPSNSRPTVDTSDAMPLQTTTTT